MAPLFQALLVEENPATLLTLQNALTRLGWQSAAVGTAEAGIDELKKGRYDAVFAELCVREQGGRSIARWLKNQNSQTRVFMVTSWKGELDSRLLLVDGICDVIRKPLIFSEIRDKVLRHFG